MINPKSRIDLKQKALQLKQKGYSVAEAANVLLLPKSTVWDWFNDRKRSNDPISYKNQNLTTFQGRETFNKNNFDVQEFLEQLAPINLKAPKFNTPKSRLNDFAVIMNDLHFPMHCQRSIDIAFAVIDELKPKTIVINGDSLDMLAISRYPKDIRKQFNLLDELRND